MREEKSESQQIINDWRANAKKNLGTNQNFIKRLNKKKLDFERITKLHEETFDNLDCLDCGNCCKTAHPIFTKTDTSRISDFLGMKIGQFEQTFLKADNEGDLVPVQIPCPFLNTDNTCQVYEVRPKSCRTYPHTHSKEGWERINLLAKNTITCPAAFRIVERMRVG